MIRGAVEPPHVKWGKDMEQGLEDRKTAYMERYGIIEANRDGILLKYYVSYPAEHCTYKVTVNLITNEETRQEMKRYYKKGLVNY